MKTLISISLLATLAACGVKDATDAASTSGTTSQVLTTINALASAYPGSLAISVFPTDTSSGLRLADAPTAAADETGADRPPEEKQKEAEDRMKGEGKCFNPRQLGEFKARFSGIKCYEFDSDMNPHRLSGDTADRFGTTNGLDGISGSTQACLVTFTKSQVDEVVHTVDRSLALVQGLICVEKQLATAESRAVRTPPVDGDALSFVDSINAKIPDDAPITFTKADISAVTNDAGTTTYITEISVKNEAGKSDSIILRHTPASGDDTTESGVLSFVRQAPSAVTKLVNPPPPGNNQQNDPNASQDKADVLTIQYAKTTTNAVENMKAELVHAQINKKYETLDEDGLINFAAISQTASNTDIHGIKYVSFDLVPSTGEGSLSYWMNPGGNYAESARGMVFNLTADDTTGLLSGCGTTGATSDVSIRATTADTSKVLAPTRYWHPQGNQNVSPNKDARYTANEGNFITQQCVQQNTSGSYDIDTSKITSSRGYEVIAGSDSTVRAPARPPEKNLPPPPKS